MQRLQRILKPETDQDKQQQQILILLLIAGIGYYFFSYLPQEERRELEMLIQTDIYKLEKIQTQPQEYSNHLIKLQGYLKWTTGTPVQQEALENRKEELNKAIDWLKDAERRMADENAQNRTREEEERKQKEMEVIKKKRFHWLRKPKSWADDYLAADKGKYDANVIKSTIEKADAFTSFAHYKIHFPPALWNSLTSEQQKLAKGKGYNELTLDEETKLLEFNDKIEDWYNEVINDPVRGNADPDTKKDNNALFYGTEGTGKTSIVRKLVYETNFYPLVEIKGSSLSPNKLDSDVGVDALGKFIFTLCDIDHTLKDDFGFRRETNGEVRHILFVDEADLVSKDSRLGEYTYLVFLKECMEQISKERQSQNLWIFATNHIEMIARAVYRPGRLSNPLDFSWTLGDFMRYARKKGITSQFPQHWHETDTLNDEDNKWANRFNAMNFKDEFLPFWRKFINHPETKRKLPEIKLEDATPEYPEQPGIKLGEFFEFFWNLRDSGQLANFNGKWDPPRKPKIEESIPRITEAIDIRLKGVYDQAKQIKDEIKIGNENHAELIRMGITQITGMLAEIGKKINN